MRRQAGRGDTGIIEANERFWTPATMVTVVRTGASLALTATAAVSDDLRLLVIGLVVYWVGDSLDGLVARLTGCESRIGAVTDIACDRLNAAFFYLGLMWLDPSLLVPIAIYLVQFMVVDLLLSLSFVLHPIRSPNYFYVVDETIWRLNWSHPGKAVNSGLFAILLLTTGWVVVASVVALALLALKVASARRLILRGLPTPSAPPTAPSADRPAADAVL